MGEGNDGEGNKEDNVDGGAEVAAEQDIEPRRVVPSPVLPSASQVALHRLTHHPYRSWCDECVEAFGRERVHCSSDHPGGRSIPLISMDYLFVNDKGVWTRQELIDSGVEESTTLKVLVVYDSATNGLFVHAVPCKGANDFVVKSVVDCIAWLGHSRVVLRADGEPAMKAMIFEALKGLKVEGLDSAAPEHSVPYDPQTNGSAEAAVKLAKGGIRCNQLTLEKLAQARVPVGHPILTWLVRHVGFLRLTCVRGADGMTPFERARGKACRSEFYAFGEYCRYKCRSHEGHIAGTDQRWSFGIWLGIELESGQNVLYDCKDEVIRHARTVMHLPDAQKFDKEKLALIKLATWSDHKSSDPGVSFRERVQDDQQVAAGELAKIRQLYLRQSDFDSHGYTDGCKKCEHTRVYGNNPDNKTTSQHSDVCRTRIVAELTKSVAGQDRIAKAAARADTFLEATLRNNDEQIAAQGEQREEIDRRPADGVGAPHLRVYYHTIVESLCRLWSVLNRLMTTLEILGLPWTKMLLLAKSLEARRSMLLTLICSLPLTVGRM